MVHRVLAILAMLGLLAAAGKAPAQTITFNARVSFPFVVGNQTLPAGNIAHANLIPDVEQTASESSELKPASRLQRIEAWLREAFGGDDETIANSLRGL